MKYLSVAETAKKWNISERTVRNYCATGKIPDAFLTGKTWNIPENAKRPERISKKNDKPTNLLEVLKAEKNGKIKGGIYHKIQIELTYNSNHIEGSRLTHEQTRYIYETNTIGITDKALNVDDIVETANHFKCIDMVIDNANQPLSEKFIKQLHLTLKSGTSDSRKDWFAVGDYKKLPNEVGGMETTLPEQVSERMKTLIDSYNRQKSKTFDELIEFHYAFESIHPFQDGNGRVGRLILFKECLRNNIVPFIIDDDLKIFYYRGLHEWKMEKGYLIDTGLTAQDKFKKYLDYFRVPYQDGKK
ncbi:MAG: Fic family protein [Clostridia bacterium]|nr:Fic family protein [Clostridia bacterium]